MSHYGSAPISHSVIGPSFVCFLVVVRPVLCASKMVVHTRNGLCYACEWSTLSSKVVEPSQNAVTSTNAIA